jgi:hypothetical protein
MDAFHPHNLPDAAKVFNPSSEPERKPPTTNDNSAGAKPAPGG